jgi:hypothetical protein
MAASTRMKAFINVAPCSLVKVDHPDDGGSTHL